MLQRITPKGTSQAQAIAIPMDGEEGAVNAHAATLTSTSLYTVALVVRIGLVAAILLRALTLWQW